jgi:hypothetical protein
LRNAKIISAQTQKAAKLIAVNPVNIRAVVNVASNMKARSPFRPLWFDICAQNARVELEL